MDSWINYIAAIVAGLTATIPLVIKLIEYVKAAIQEKNWNALVKLVMGYMMEAEKKFTDGSTRKEWCLAMILTSADTINYDVDMNVVSKLIDDLCAMSKNVNVTVSEAPSD